MVWTRTSTERSSASESRSSSRGTRGNATASAARSVTTPASTTGANGASPSSSTAKASRTTATTAVGTVARGLSAKHIAALEARGIDPEAAIRYGLYTEPGKFTGEDGALDAIVFPFVREGQTINRKYRGPGKRFLKDQGSQPSLWNEDALRDPTLAKLPLVVTEGEFDALAALQSDIPRTVSVPDGAGSNLDFLAGIWDLIGTVPRVILGGDADPPGRKLNAELARRLGAARCAWLEYPDGCKDLNDVLRAHGEAGVRDCVAGARPYPIRGLYKLSDYPDVSIETFPTGWANVDQIFRLWPEEFCVVTGVPSHGKSLWALNLAAQMAETHGHNWAVASFEMRARPYIKEILERFKGGASDATLAWIDKHFTFIDQDPSEFERIDIDWVIDKASDAVIRYGVRWLLLDPWNQIQHARKPGESGVEYQERAIADLKRFGRAHGCGVIVVTHPTKEVKDKRTGKLRVPGLYDIDGSAHWYNAADHGVVIDRPDLGRNFTNIIVAKSRYHHGGKPGTAGLKYDWRVGRYVPAEAEEAPGE